MHIHAASAVIENELRTDVCIESHNGLISAINSSCTAQSDREVLGVLIPGFVDIHCHGGGGFYFSNVDIESVKKARAMHLSHGTTTLIASLVTEPIGILEEQIRRIAPLVDEGIFGGIHLEGPYLSEHRCGAHQPSLLRAPGIEEVAALIDAGDDTISMVTLAPELVGGIEAVEYLTSRGVVAALGHSQADADTTHAAIAAGGKLITHFSNGMPKPANGAGTIASAALEHGSLPLEIILDGEHITDEILGIVKSAGDRRSILITDAMSAAGQPDGKYSIGALDVTVRNGIARLDSNGSLAGSTLTMDNAFRRLLTSGPSIVDCVYAASTLPAQTLNLGEVGSIAVGKKADLLEYSADGVITLI